MSRLIPKFVLRSPNGSEPSEIHLRLNYDYKRFVYPLRDPQSGQLYKISPSLWDKKEQCPLLSGDVEEGISLCIADVKVGVRKALEYARVNKVVIDNQFLKEQLDIHLNVAKKGEDEVVKTEVTLCQFYQKVIREMEQGNLLTDKNVIYNNATIKSHRRTFGLIQEFDLINKHDTLFVDINNDWYDKFRFFLTYEYEDMNNGFFKEDYSPSTVGKHIKNLKMVMKLAVDKNVSSNKEYERKYFEKPKNESFAIYLTEEEIRKIYDVDLTGSPLEKYRDMFLIGCYTALRVSDYTTILPENFKETAKGTRIIEIITKKTKQRVQIPIIYEELLEIAEKYNYNFPKVTTQKLNDAIKRVGEMAGLTDLVTYDEHKGGKIRKVSCPKYKLIQSHTGRRSAATNLYNIHKIPEASIMLLTGHKTSENFRRYIKISTEENADSIAEHVKEQKEWKKNN